MSWLAKLSNKLFPSKKKFLPEAPSIMAASSPWYCDAPIKRSLVEQRILQDVLTKKKELETIDLEKIIRDVTEDADLGGYRGYFLLWHKGFVEDVYKQALYKYIERHNRNMEFLRNIVFLRICINKYLN